MIERQGLDLKRQLLQRDCRVGINLIYIALAFLGHGHTVNENYKKTGTNGCLGVIGWWSRASESTIWNPNEKLFWAPLPFTQHNVHSLNALFYKEKKKTQLVDLSNNVVWKEVEVRWNPVTTEYDIVN